MVKLTIWHQYAPASCSRVEFIRMQSISVISTVGCNLSEFIMNKSVSQKLTFTFFFTQKKKQNLRHVTG